MPESLRMIYGIARQLAGPAADEYLHDIIYWHFGLTSMKQLSSEQTKYVRELLESLEDHVADGRDAQGRTVIPWTRA